MRSFIKCLLLLLFYTGVLAQNAPTATIAPSSSLFCTGLPLTFTALTSSSPLSYSWSLTSTKGVSSITDLNSPSLAITFTANLVYTLNLSVSDGSLSANTSTVFQVYRQPRASFYAALDGAGFPANLTLTNYSSGGLKNYWSYNDVGVVDSLTNTSRNYTAPGNYTVTLTTKGLAGCNDVSSYAFEIAGSSSVKLPNVFTPNNDGINEIYKPILSGISELKAGIYNRYGLLVYAWDKVNGAWDGYTTSGLPCAEGQYFISLEATGFDGQKYKLKGAITLAR